VNAASGIDTDRPVEESGSAAAVQLFGNYYEERLKLFPMEATYAGDHRYDDQLPNDITDSFRASEAAFFRKYLTTVNELDGGQLSTEDQLSCDILRWECETQLEKLRFPTHLMPINQFNSLHLDFGQWATGTSAQPFKTVGDYENWLKRLEAFTEWGNTAISNMRQGMKRGWVLPKALIKKTIPQMAAMSKGPAEDHLFYEPIKRMPAQFPEADQVRLRTAYAAMIRDKIIPVFGELERFLTDEYLPAGRESSGIDAIPQGAEFYRSQIRQYTTTSMTAEEIHELGLREVARLQSEMEKVKQSVGFQGDLKGFFNNVRQRKELIPFSEPTEVLEHFQTIRRKLEPALPHLFRLTPKTPLEIHRTEAFREATASPEWDYGSLDRTRPGIFYVPIPKVREYSVLQDEATFLHEAFPGHHYQFSLQRENTKLPMFRRVIDYSAFGEGWALYCESLGKELGLYDDPYQYFGMLSMEMHRAIRLVVDTGLHAKSWTREQAIQYSLSHEAESEASVVSEVERYMAWPSQALSFKIGQLKIRELRTRAQQALGSRFDIRDFHDQVLESGCMPLQILEKKVQQWINVNRSNQRQQ
jgi:uncharacterized protein (DUF885 family)